MTPHAISIARDLIARWEGFSAFAYQCSAGVWTIGYGHTCCVSPGDVVTMDEALDLLESDMHKAIECVDMNVDVELTDEQLAALVSFTFNLGCGAFHGSTLLKCINAGRLEAAAAQFQRWDKANGKSVQGLLNRRNSERSLFMGVV